MVVQKGLSFAEEQLETIEKVKAGVEKIERNLELVRSRVLVEELKRKKGSEGFLKDAEYYRGWLLQHLNLVNSLADIIGSINVELDETITEFVKQTEMNVKLIEDSLNDLQIYLEVG